MEKNKIFVSSYLQICWNIARHRGLAMTLFSCACTSTLAGNLGYPGTACNFCHAVHPEKSAKLDKRQRMLLQGMNNQESPSFAIQEKNQLAFRNVI